mgnify:CR=1 FL=1
MLLLTNLSTRAIIKLAGHLQTSSLSSRIRIDDGVFVLSTYHACLLGLSNPFWKQRLLQYLALYAQCWNPVCVYLACYVLSYFSCLDQFLCWDNQICRPSFLFWLVERWSPRWVLAKVELPNSQLARETCLLPPDPARSESWPCSIPYLPGLSSRARVHRSRSLPCFQLLSILPDDRERSSHAATASIERQSTKGL